jgi:hypothetical protein
MHLLYVVNVSHAFGVPRKSYTKDTKGRKGKRELIMLCLGCSKLGKSDTYKGTEGVYCNCLIQFFYCELGHSNSLC